MKKVSTLGTSLEELLERATSEVSKESSVNLSSEEHTVNSDYLFEKGISLLKEEKSLLAAAHFLAVTLLDPQNVKAWNNLGIAYFKLKQEKEALQAFEKALEIDPQNEIAKKNLTFLKNILFKEEGRNVQEKAS